MVLCIIIIVIAGSFRFKSLICLGSLKKRRHRTLIFPVFSTPHTFSLGNASKYFLLH